MYIKLLNYFGLNGEQRKFLCQGYARAMPGLCQGYAISMETPRHKPRYLLLWYVCALTEQIEENEIK